MQVGVAGGGGGVVRGGGERGGGGAVVLGGPGLEGDQAGGRGRLGVGRQSGSLAAAGAWSLGGVLTVVVSRPEDGGGVALVALPLPVRTDGADPAM